MKILYGFSNCSYQKYNSLFLDASVMILQQAQKYHSMMTTGLAANGVEVQCISGLPINRNYSRSIYTCGGNDEENGVRFHYFSSINLPGLRQLILACKSFAYTIFVSRKDVAICDILNVSIVLGMHAACKLKRIPLIGIVTDVPGKLAYTEELRFAERISKHVMQQMNGYVLLTKEMNEIVNPNRAPYVVIEGQVDCGMENRANTLEVKFEPKVILYAGSLKKIYGISRLVDAFISLDMPFWELYVYGDGDYKNDLLEVSKLHSNVKYMGIRPNSEIVEAEERATILVNPRPTDEEYTKYSFPSKNMEYMASGTPLLTTKLPSMPCEYIDYVFFFDDETIEGMTNTLRHVFRLPSHELHQKGLKAKEFVLHEKNNKVQARKIVELIQRLE